MHAYHELYTGCRTPKKVDGPLLLLSFTANSSISLESPPFLFSPSSSSLTMHQDHIRRGTLNVCIYAHATETSVRLPISKLGRSRVTVRVYICFPTETSVSAFAYFKTRIKTAIFYSASFFYEDMSAFDSPLSILKTTIKSIYLYVCQYILLRRHQCTCLFREEDDQN